LEQLISTEKDAREQWIHKYEQEQESHVLTNAELLRVRSLHQDADMSFKNTKINLDTLGESKRQLGLAHQELQQQASQLKAQNENL
jgi:hypothetical protein